MNVTSIKRNGTVGAWELVDALEESTEFWAQHALTAE